MSNQNKRLKLVCIFVFCYDAFMLPMLSSDHKKKYIFKKNVYKSNTKTISEQKMQRQSYLGWGQPPPPPPPPSYNIGTKLALGAGTGLAGYGLYNLVNNASNQYLDDEEIEGGRETHNTFLRPQTGNLSQQVQNLKNENENLRESYTRIERENKKLNKLNKGWYDENRRLKARLQEPDDEIRKGKQKSLYRMQLKNQIEPKKK